eukprot:snap_masked-scaffold_37-processed-gene-1.31-mRNA-1 protein AED:1.00 eAED:1.00 QI:0/0/0/0/1/1/2/0/63
MKLSTCIYFVTSVSHLIKVLIRLKIQKANILLELFLCTFHPATKRNNSSQYIIIREKLYFLFI